MTTDQRGLVRFYSGSTIAAFIIVVGYLVVWRAYKVISSLWSDATHEVGDASSLLFRDIGGIQAYIPVVNRADLTEPVICVKIDVSNSNFRSADCNMQAVFKVNILLHDMVLWRCRAFLRDTCRWTT